MCGACGYMNESFGPAFTRRDGQDRNKQALSTRERLLPTDPQLYHPCVMCQDISILV